MIYAEENLGNRKTETIRRKFVESIFVLRENKSMTIMTIIDALEEEHQNKNTASKGSHKLNEQ